MDVSWPEWPPVWTRLYADNQKPGYVRQFPSSISLSYFFLRRQKQTNKHVVPMPWSALEGIYWMGEECVFVFFCVFLLILLFAEQNNQDFLAPDAACAQSNLSEVQLNECGYRPNNKMVNCALISCSSNQCLLQFWPHKCFLIQ